MKNLLSKLVNFHSTLNASPYSIFNTKFRKKNYDLSDFFAFRLDGYEMIFIAENNLALLVGRHIKCKHLFHFFDSEGNACGVKEVKDDKFNYQLEINESITNGKKMGSFTHHINYPQEVFKEYSVLLSDLSFQHRGYSGYRKAKDFGYSYMHGNFGGLYFDNDNHLKSLSRLRRGHIYTPQFVIKQGYSYDFLFSNPTKRNVTIKFYLNHNKALKYLVEALVPPYGTHKTSLNEAIIYDNYNISWETNFPIGRCTIFEYNSNFFDVFHS